MTVRDLYEIAADRHLLDAPIRICDGMAVSFYPESPNVIRGRYELVIDVSDLPMIDFDDLPENRLILPRK